MDLEPDVARLSWNALLMRGVAGVEVVELPAGWSGSRCPLQRQVPTIQNIQKTVEVQVH